jgi:hypothetical protein
LKLGGWKRKKSNRDREKSAVPGISWGRKRQQLLVRWRWSGEEC